MCSKIRHVRLVYQNLDCFVSNVFFLKFPNFTIYNQVAVAI